VYIRGASSAWIGFLDQSGAGIVQLQGAGLRYGTAAEVLRDLDLRLEPGSLQVLTGPGGAGKTSLLRLLGLMRPPTRGRLVLFGQDTGRLAREALPGLRRRIGVVFEDLRLLEHLSAFANLALPLRFAGTPPEPAAARIQELLAWLGLGEVAGRRPGELAMGQRQLLAVARAVIGRPDLLLADEPLSHLDSTRGRQVMRLFDTLGSAGATVLVATRDEALAQRHGLPRLRLEGGRLHQVEATAAAES
jgi:cell division transport system ATP-binding protein